ncbi:peroxiredoxin [Desulfosporosinus sp. HMP52]|nr:peroxiredoxin [Desulfosporosinus sp. HMP52]
MAAQQETLQKLGIQVLAISTDSVYSHKIFAETSPSARTVWYPLLSDRSHFISNQYGVLRKELGMPYRATFIISPSGRVKYVSLYPPEVGRNVAEVIRIIQGLIYEEMTGQGVPAYWKPGMTGILIDFKNVGKI